MHSRFDHLERLRSEELAHILALLPPQSVILEIGAGMGWQAKALAERGYSVTAIDLPGSSEAKQRKYAVIEYDGSHIPFPDDHFEVVFSSNVLEHIPHLEAFQAEIARVLEPGGKAIHIVPSGCWRFWTTLAYYPYLMKKIWNHIFPGGARAAGGNAESSAQQRKLLRKLFPPRHGERGSFLSEVLWFSRWQWQRHFRKTGWKIEAYSPGRLFYTGYEILNLKLSLQTRRRLSRILGSACHVFCLSKNNLRAHKTQEEPAPALHTN
ncbi:MAG: class I SAM-dependent methyltransferase [bacterium]